ncbi:PorV/PorQ family protein [bacterium]|nr:PorV/PorQ family protein [bacterium]
MKKILWIVLALFMPAVRAAGQGTTGAPFLEIGVGPRACAMGEAYTAIADDPSAVYWNPAGLNRIRSNDLMFSYHFWLLDMSLQHAGGVLPTRWGNFGCGLFYSSSGPIPRIEGFLKTGEYTAFDAALSLSYGRPLSGALSAGVTVKTIVSQIDKVNASTFAVDAGLLVDTAFVPGLSLGVSVQNIGPGLKFIDQVDPLPLCIRAGAGYTRSDLTVGAALNDYIQGEKDAGIGCEYVFLDALALRIGYNTRNALSGGLGLLLSRLDIGYAVAQFKDIGLSHMISLRIRNL